MKIPALTGLAAFSFLALAAALAAEKEKPGHPYPEGFLKWQQVKATSLDPKNPATAALTDAHFVYANEKAVEGLRTGKYPEGAVFVLDILKVTKKDGVTILGDRDSTSTMARDASHTDTGGWAFDDFDLASHAALPVKARDRMLPMPHPKGRPELRVHDAAQVRPE